MAGGNIIDEITNVPYGIAIGEGLISGRESFWGFSTRKSISTIETGNDIWTGVATTLSIPTSGGEQMEIVSTSTDDTDGGIGVRTVMVHYLDENGDEDTEIVTLNGTTPVQLPYSTIRFVQFMHTNTRGSNTVAKGKLSIYRQSDSSAIYNTIEIGGNMSLNTARMVPNGKVAYIKSFVASVTGDKPVDIRLRATAIQGDIIPETFLFKDAVYIGTSGISHQYDVPIEVPSLGLIKVSGWSDFTGASVSARWDGWLKTI